MNILTKRFLISRVSVLRSQPITRPSILLRVPLRYASSTPSKKPLHQQQPQTYPSPPPPTKRTPNLPESFRKTIPGETDQSNSIWTRLPTFPLRNNSTLLPKPGVPTSTTHNLRQMMEVLEAKRQPELIYEAEPHKLYFLFCGAFALVFAIYGLTFLEWSASSAYALYKQDGDLWQIAWRTGAILGVFAIASSVVSLAVLIPTRLIRRIWLLPGKQKHIKFTTHPLLPGRATPVHTLPLGSLNRTKRGRIFTRNGIYGTLDKGTFFFILREKGKKAPWLVDRNGWFWGDGRVHDVLFGKESLEEAEEALTYDEKFGKATKKLKEEKTKLREELGPAWRFKVGAEMIREDIAQVKQNVNKKNQLAKKTKSKKAVNKKK